MKDFLQIMANIYGLSDKCVYYSENVYGEHIFTLQEEFISDHEFLDGFYHKLQERLSLDDKSAMTGQKLFELSKIDELDDEYDCYEIVDDILAGYETIGSEVEEYIKDLEDLDVQNDFIDFLKKVKIKINKYTKFLQKKQESDD